MPQTKRRSEPDLQANLQIASNIETIAELHALSVRSIPRHQRVIEIVTGHLGRPVSLYIMLITIAAWITFNALAPQQHWRLIDPPPFYWMQGAISLSALIVSTMVLITQNRQATLAEQRSHLDIQVNLLAEQKITKLIALVEELRNDLPNVRNRRDPEAERMTISADPLLVVEELKKSLESVEDLDDAPPDR